MPVSWATIFRMLVVLAMAAHVFYVYSFARAYQDIVGWDGPAVTAICIFSLAMLLPLAWAVALPELPEIVRRQRGRRRWEAGRCAECAYQLLTAEGDGCPECGAARRPPASYTFGWSTIRRFAVLALLAWLLGCGTAEYWALLDEHAFESEAQLHLARAGASYYTRPRRWPADDQLHYTPDGGVSAYPPRPAALRPREEGP